MQHEYVNFRNHIILIHVEKIQLFQRKIASIFVFPLAGEDSDPRLSQMIIFFISVRNTRARITFTFSNK